MDRRVSHRHRRQQEPQRRRTGTATACPSASSAMATAARPPAAPPQPSIPPGPQRSARSVRPAGFRIDTPDAVPPTSRSSAATCRPGRQSRWRRLASPPATLMLRRRRRPARAGPHHQPLQPWPSATPPPPRPGPAPRSAAGDTARGVVVPGATNGDLQPSNGSARAPAVAAMTLSIPLNGKLLRRHGRAKVAMAGFSPHLTTAYQPGARAGG